MRANLRVYKTLALCCVPWLFLIAASDAQQGSARESAAQRQQLGGLTQLYEPSAEPTGRDLILMVRHKPILVEYTPQVDWNQNAFYSPQKRADYSFTQTLNAAFETRIAEMFEARLSSYVSMTRYGRLLELDYDSFGGQASFAYPFGDFRAGADYRPSVFYGRNFNGEMLTLHDLGPFLSYQKRLENWVGAFAELRQSRIWGNPKDYDAYRVSGSGGFFFTPSSWCLISTGATGNYTSYDSFYEGLMGSSRNDMLISPFLNVAVMPAPWFIARVSCRYADNDSTDNPFSYQNLSATAQVTFTVRF
jgi:hypothetical protein